VAEGDAERPDDTMRERVPTDDRKFWFLLDANRILVACAFLLVVFVSILVVGLAHPTPAQELLTRGDPIETLYQALVTATVTGVTLVLTLSQLVLSQELGAVGDQRDRMQGAMSFRRDAESLLDDSVSPAEPSAFLRGLVDASRQRAERLRGLVDDDSPAAAFADDVTRNAESVTDQLEGAQFGEFDVVWAALNYDYSWKLYGGRRLLEGGTLDDDAESAVSDLLDVLELFGPAREHFKTLYFQWELSNLSRTLLFVAVPALTVAVCTLVFFDARDFAGVTFGVGHSLFVLAVTTTVSLSPFTILLAYILRIVTVTKRTLSIGPFILRERDHGDVLDGE
jgi:hypothetical protein